MAPKSIGNSPLGSLLPIPTLPSPPPVACFEPKKQLNNTNNNTKNCSNKQKMLPAPKSSQTRSVNNKLAESDKRPLNKTFTIVPSKPTASPPPFRRPRANSFDSDFADFGPEVIFGFISRKCGVNAGGSLKVKEQKTCWALSGWSDKKCGGSGSRAKKGSFSEATKLPSLEGFMPGRTCCQLQFTRSNFELIKYKRNLRK